MNVSGLTNTKLNERSSWEGEQKDNVEVEKAIDKVEIPWLNSWEEREKDKKNHYFGLEW